MIPPLPYPPPKVVYQDRHVEKKIYVDREVEVKVPEIHWRDKIIEKEVFVDRFVEKEVFVDREVRVEVKVPETLGYRIFVWSFWRIRISFGWRIDNPEKQA